MEEEYKVVKRDERPFPDDLEGRVNAIANIVNSEVKIATLLHLDDVPADGGEIKRRIRESIGNGVKLGKGQHFSGYCHNSLLSIGAVAEEEVIRETDETTFIGYRITDAGRKYGVPLAVFSLRWAVDNQTSLFSILGKTGSWGDSRAPFNRLHILRHLGENEELREIDLVRHINLCSSNVREHLKQLGKIGFIQYEAVPESHEAKGTFTYKFVEMGVGPKAIYGSKTLTKQVFDVMKKISTGDHHRIAQELGIKSPSNVKYVLNGLEKQGHVVKEGIFEQGKNQSCARILDRGKRFVEEFYSTWENSLGDGPVLVELQSEADEFIADSNLTLHYFSKGINNYWAVSPGKKARPLVETNAKIIDYIAKHPGTRPIEIAEKIGLSSPNHYLSPLIKAGILRNEADSKNKNATRYYVVEPTS